jgi:spore coat protein U-like protein
MLTTNLTGARAAGAWLLAAAAFGLPTAANAATVGSSLGVNATVTANCTISTTALAFGNVNTLSGSNVDGTGGLSITCTNGTGWSASADLGGGTGASFASRKMAFGSELLNYSLYTDSARSSVWGDGTGSTSLFSGTGNGSSQAVTVYGRVPSGQTSVPAGSYADTVAVTVTY